MSELQRLTTDYVESEDRIRVTGELNSKHTAVLWLSQRLLLKLLPHLFAWLEKQSRVGVPVELAQSFAQEAAKSDIALEAPVKGAKNSAEWLVSAVDITPTSDILNLRFRSDNGEHAEITMFAQPLRQWLEILNRVWSFAEWPKDTWPTWICNEKQESTKSLHTQIH